MSPQKSVEIKTKVSPAWIVICIVLAGFLGVAVWTCREQRLEAANNEAKDSIIFKDTRALVIGYIRAADEAKAQAKHSELARADERAYNARKEQAYLRENAMLKRMRAAVNTSNATTAELDSIQLSLYGPLRSGHVVGRDSTHTIPLDYSRKLTGDALRLPIEQKIATAAQTRLDSATGHYTRMEASYELDLKSAGIEREQAREIVDTLMNQVGKMQGVINDEDRKWKRKRRLERIAEAALMVGIIVLAL
jgi:hypothetical protein